MGEIADSIVDGEICQFCCCPLECVMGYPSTCFECLEEDNSSSKRARGNNALSKQLIARLMICRQQTDVIGATYAGDYLSSAKAQYAKLIARGLCKVYSPDNPSHLERVVITELGRTLLFNIE